MKSVILKLSESGFLIHNIKMQSENIMVPIYMSNFPTTKTSKTVNNRPNIPNAIKIMGLSTKMLVK